MCIRDRCYSCYCYIRLLLIIKILPLTLFIMLLVLLCAFIMRVHIIGFSEHFDVINNVKYKMSTEKSDTAVYIGRYNKLILQQLNNVDYSK